MARPAPLVALAAPVLAGLLTACTGPAPASGSAPAPPSTVGPVTPPATAPSTPAATSPGALAAPTPELPELEDEEVPPLPEGFAQAERWPAVPIAALPVKAGSPRAGTADPEPADRGPLGRVAWGELSYPTPCLGADTARLSGGTATADGRTVRLRPPVYGDLQGDGSVEAVVTLTCATDRRQPDRALLYAAGPDGAPRLLGPVATEEDRLVVDQVEFREGRLLLVGLAYSAAAQLPDPDLAVTRIAAMEGDRLRRVDAFADPITILYEGDEHDETHTETGEEGAGSG